MTLTQPSNPARTDVHRAGEGAAPLSRRRLIAAAAWSVPVVALAAAVPAATASTQDVYTATIANGDVSQDGHSVTFGVDAGDQSIALALALTKNGAPYTGDVTATLSGASGVAAWSGSGSDITIASAAGGSADLPVDILGYGTFWVIVSVGGTSIVLNVTFRAA